MDIIYNRTRDLIATSGNSALMSITDKPSIASVKASQAIQASKNDYLTRQFESFLDQFVNQFFDLKHKWKFTLWGDIFYWRDDAKMTKELFLAGAKGLLPKLLSSEGMSLEDYRSSTLYIESLGIKIESNEQKLQEQALNNQLTTAKLNIASKSESTSSGKTGRPKLDDTAIENDNTGISNDMGNNISDIKESSSSSSSVISSTSYSYNEVSDKHKYCVVCGEELDNGENDVHDMCKEFLKDV